jgi:hypothetical protein
MSSVFLFIQFNEITHILARSGCRSLQQSKIVNKENWTILSQHDWYTSWTSGEVQHPILDRKLLTAGASLKSRHLCCMKEEGTKVFTVCSALLNIRYSLSNFKNKLQSYRLVFPVSASVWSKIICFPTVGCIWDFFFIRMYLK